MKYLKLSSAILILIVTTYSSFAQRAISYFSVIQNQNVPSSNLRNVIDTIVTTSFIPANQGGLGCFTGIYSSDSGYVTGNNAYGDLEKAQFFDLARMGYANSGSVQSVLVKVAYKTLSPYPGTVAVKIYDVDTTGFEPFNLLGTSQPVNLSSISDNGEYTLFVFDSPVQVSDSFFVSVQLPSANGDTLVILSTQDNCVENSAWAWEQWSDGTWHSILTSWIHNIDLAIFPIMDLPYGNGIASLPEDFQLSIYPNPATDFVTIHFSGDSKPISFRIINMEGKIVEQGSAPIEISGNSAAIVLGGLRPSLYFLEIESDYFRWRTPLCITK